MANVLTKYYFCIIITIESIGMVIIMPKRIENPDDIIGMQFGKLTVVSYLGREKQGKQTVPMYNCVCSCGTPDVKVSRWSLKRGYTTSCGCAHKDAGKQRTEDLTGQRFGRWIVLGQTDTRYSASGKTRSIMWLCQCDCGTIKPVGARALKTGMSTSCGCLQREHVSARVVRDLSGMRFGFLTVVSRAGSYRSKNRNTGVRARWHCICDCGNECDVLGESLLNGDTTSCGCKKQSKYELYVQQYLESHGYQQDVTYFREKTFQGLTGVGGQLLRFDFVVLTSSKQTVLIECQGEQHVRSTDWFGGSEYFEKLKIHDQKKRDFAVANQYLLIEVPYTKVLYQDISEFLDQYFCQQDGA